MSEPPSNGLGEAGGLLTRVDTPPRAAPKPGERLGRELEDLERREALEAGNASDRRAEIAEALAARKEERTALLAQAAGLKRQADELNPRIEDLERQMAALPDDARVRAQRARDRLSRLGRVLHADTYAVDAMLDAYSDYITARRTWESSARQRPEMAKDMELLEYADTSAAAIAGLDPVVRDIIEQRVADARSRAASFPEPQRPTEVAPIYLGTAAGPSGSMIATVAIPCAPSALAEHQPHSVFVAEVTAAMSRALLDLTDADAPVVRLPSDHDDPLDEVVLLGARCTDVDDELFGARLLEIFEECRSFGVALVPIANTETELALAGLIDAEVSSR